MSLLEETLSSETLLEGIVFRVERQAVRLADGSRSRRDIVRHGGGVGVLARTPGGKWVLVRQYRKSVEGEVLEIVAGMRETGEAPEVTGRRELEEETGYTAGEMVPLGSVYSSPGYTDEVVHLFYAETGETPGGNRLDADERLEVVEMGDEALRAMLDEGEAVDGKTVAAYHFAMRKGLV